MQVDTGWCQVDTGLGPRSPPGLLLFQSVIVMDSVQKIQKKIEEEQEQKVKKKEDTKEEEKEQKDKK